MQAKISGRSSYVCSVAIISLSQLVHDTRYCMRRHVCPAKAWSSLCTFTVYSELQNPYKTGLVSINGMDTLVDFSVIDLSLEKKSSLKGKNFSPGTVVIFFFLK